MQHSWSRIVVGALLLIAGIVVWLALAGAISLDEKSINAPKWVIVLIGLLFIASGLAAGAISQGSVATWSGGAVVVTMTVISGWVALFGSSAHFSGDNTFLSKSADEIVTRIIFGSVSLLGLAIIGAAALKTWNRGGR